MKTLFWVVELAFVIVMFLGTSFIAYQFMAKREKMSALGGILLALVCLIALQGLLR